MMKKSHHLLLRTAILPGESLPSYLVRLAKRNGYHTPNMVIQLCKEGLSQSDNITRPTHAETYARVADLVRLDDDQLHAASVHNFAFTMLPAGIEPDFFTLRSGRAAVILPAAVLREHSWPETDVPFCPHCLAEARYHRLAWLPQAISVCLQHHCLLIKGCPICGSKLGMGDIVEGRCHQCAFALETSPTISIAGLYGQQVSQS